MAEYPAWGIHITEVSLRAVKLEEDGNAIRVVAHDRIDFVEDVEDLGSLQRFGAQLHALAVFIQRHELRNSRIWISVDGSAAFNRFVETPTTQGESLAKILEYEAQQQVPFKFDEVYWDHKVLTEALDGPTIEVLLFAIKKHVVDDRIRRLNKARFSVDGVQLAPVALYNFAVHEGYAKSGYVLVGVDYDRTDVVFCHSDRLWFRTLPVGVHGLVEDLRDALGVKHRVAVQIAEGSAECPDVKVMKAVAKSCAEKVAVEVARLVAYWRGARQEVEFKGIVLIPGTRFAPPLGPELKARTGLDVFAIKGFRNIVIEDAIATPEIAASVATLAHATGLALQGVGKANLGIRLFAPTLERVIAGRRVFYVLSMMVVLALIAVMWIITWKEGRKVRDAIDALATTVRVAEADGEEFKRSRVEAGLLATMSKYEEIGKHRLVPVNALDHLVSAVVARNAHKDDDTRCYVVNVETKAGDVAVGRAQCALTVTLGAVLSGTIAETAQRIESEIIAGLRSTPQVKDLTVGVPFAAPTLSATPGVENEERLLRRTFVMLRFTYTWDES